MITVNAIYSQISDNLPNHKLYKIKSNDNSDATNSFENVINGVIDNTSIDSALRLAAQNFGISYQSIRDRFSENGDFNENAKSFLYGVAVATSALNLNTQTNIVLNSAYSIGTNNITSAFTTDNNYATNTVGTNTLNNIDYSTIAY